MPLNEKRPTNSGVKLPYDEIPDVRDGLTRVERIVLYVLYELKKEYGERHIPTILIYGRVVELVDISQDDLQNTIARLNERRGL